MDEHALHHIGDKMVAEVKKAFEDKLFMLDLKFGNTGKPNVCGLAEDDELEAQATVRVLNQRYRNDAGQGPLKYLTNAGNRNHEVVIDPEFFTHLS